MFPARLSRGIAVRRLSTNESLRSNEVHVRRMPGNFFKDPAPSSQHGESGPDRRKPRKKGPPSQFGQSRIIREGGALMRRQGQRKWYKWDDTRLPHCFGFAIKPDAPKERVIEEMKTYCDSIVNRERHVSDVAIVLVSKGLASWLGDKDFLASLIQPLVPMLPPVLPIRGFCVVFAAVDHVSRTLMNHEPPMEGLSVIHGKRHRLLTGIFRERDTPRTDGTASVVESAPGLLPSLVFKWPHWPAAERSCWTEVTVPLANTVFNNGQTHTMIATRWAVDSFIPNSKPSLLESVARDTVAIGCPAWEKHIQFTPSLLPITHPRRIVSGLGNILREVEVGGKPVPASQELEAVVPALLEAYSKNPAVVMDEPLGVWAVIMSEQDYELTTKVCEPEIFESMDSIRYSIPYSVDSVRKLLGCGAQIRRVLSGGGGWGAKKGLLSLDPQTRYTKDDDRDVQDFIDSFHGEERPGSVGLPGSYVQFFVAPPPNNEDLTLRPRKGRGKPKQIVMVGTPQNQKWFNKWQKDVEPFRNKFGAFSTQGFFLSYKPAKPALGSVDSNGIVSMKIDCPSTTMHCKGTGPLESLDLDKREEVEAGFHLVRKVRLGSL